MGQQYLQRSGILELYRIGVDFLFDKIKTFWNTFWATLKTAFNSAFKNPVRDIVQDFRDTNRINFLAIFVSKLNNLTNTEATFDVALNSDYADEISELAEDLETRRFDVTSEMLAYGDFWVFPSTDSSGKLYHRYVPQDDVRILDMDGEKITKLVAVIDTYSCSDGKTYFLNRVHTLDGDVLTVETYVSNSVHERVFFENWQEFEGTYSFYGANNIGVGRFKSPTSSRGKSLVYGVPLNYGCSQIEEIIFNDISMIETEYRNARSILFADPLCLKKRFKTTYNANGKKITDDGWEIPENLFPYDTRGGQSGVSIDVFSPTIRQSEFSAKLYEDMHRYEQQIGTDRGFLTPFENGTDPTATEIKRANASTIALIDKIRTAIKSGVETTLKADALFLNIPDDAYSVQIDWYDVFADEIAAYNRIREAVQDGVAEKIDQMQWLFPNLSTDELLEKLQRIDEEKLANFQNFTINSTETPEEEDEENKNLDEN